jgi:YHS domain-containing protein
MSTLLFALACAESGAADPVDVAATLAAADAHDGQTDKIVHECATCGLGMKGDPAHKSTHEGYELHFCSESCKHSFDKDPAKGVAKLQKAVQPK